MSLISDALQKAQEQRSKSPARISDWNGATLGAAQERSATTRTSSSGFFFANLAVLAAVCVVALYFFRDRSTHLERSSSVATAVPTPAVEQKSEMSTTASPSTLVPAAPAEVTPAPARSEAFASSEPPVTSDYELGGMSSLGSNTLLSIIRKEDKRSLWVAVGKTVGEVTAVSYDPSSDRAVIRVHGNLLSVAAKESARVDPAAHAAE
jgi:hypothetical protein